jgi:hypothetical protein
MVSAYTQPILTAIACWTYALGIYHDRAHAPRHLDARLALSSGVEQWINEPVAYGDITMVAYFEGLADVAACGCKPLTTEDLFSDTPYSFAHHLAHERARGIAVALRKHGGH